MTASENVQHIVSDAQHLKAFAALSPHALCGVKLTLRAKAKYPTEDAPDCPECAAMAR